MACGGDGGGGGKGKERRQLTEEMVFMRTKCNRMDLIRNLNLWGNDLHNIGILRLMPNLEVLSLSVNQVSSLAALTSCPKLSELYLRKNNIYDLAEVQYLESCPQLRVLWLNDNPCALLPHYREYVLHHLPNLAKLDSQDVTEEERRRAAAAEMGDVQTCVGSPPNDNGDEEEAAAGGGSISAPAYEPSRTGRTETFGAPPPSQPVQRGLAEGSGGGGGGIQRGYSQPFEDRHAEQQPETMVRSNTMQEPGNAGGSSVPSRTSRGSLRSSQDSRSSKPVGGGAYHTAIGDAWAAVDQVDPTPPPLPPRRQVPSHHQVVEDAEQDPMRGPAIANGPNSGPSSCGRRVDERDRDRAAWSNTRSGVDPRGNGDSRGGADAPGIDPRSSFDPRGVSSDPRNGTRGGDTRDTAGGQRAATVSGSWDRDQQREDTRRRVGSAGTGRGQDGCAGGGGGAANPAREDSGAARGDNILCAVLALIKELDGQGLELVRRAIEQRQYEL